MAPPRPMRSPNGRMMRMVDAAGKPRAVPDTCKDECPVCVPQECPYYYKAFRCVLGPCKSPEHVYVCGDRLCPDENPMGDGALVRLSTGECYKVAGDVKYVRCLPGDPPPPGFQCLPDDAVTFDDATCLAQGPNAPCDHGQCKPAHAYIPGRRCKCSPPDFPHKVWITCEAYYDELKKGNSCPTIGFVYQGKVYCYTFDQAQAKHPKFGDAPPPPDLVFGIGPSYHSSCCSCCPGCDKYLCQAYQWLKTGKNDPGTFTNHGTPAPVCCRPQFQGGTLYYRFTKKGIIQGKLCLKYRITYSGPIGPGTLVDVLEETGGGGDIEDPDFCIGKKTVNPFQQNFKGCDGKAVLLGFTTESGQADEGDSFYGCTTWKGKAKADQLAQGGELVEWEWLVVIQPNPGDCGPDCLRKLPPGIGITPGGPIKISPSGILPAAPPGGGASTGGESTGGESCGCVH